MKKIIVFIQRVLSGSFKRLFRNIRLVHEESGKNSILIFFDLLFSMMIYGTGYLDYMTFGFVYIKKDKRKTFMNMNDNITLNQKLNDKAYQHIFENKIAFNHAFSEYLGRGFLDMKKTSPEEFAAFCKDKESVFAKQTESFGGLGVKKITLSEITDLKALYHSLVKDKFDLVEETILQHEEMNRLCARSINTLRIATLLDPEGKAHCAYVLLRVGNGQKDVDNVSSGGMYTMVGEDGTVRFPAFCDKIVTYYEEHPATKVPFVGFSVPCYKEAVALCLEAALRVPQMRYIGWDVAISPSGPCLVEGNSFPGYDMPQNHTFHPDGCGLKPLFEEILKEKI